MTRFRGLYLISLLALSFGLFSAPMNRAYAACGDSDRVECQTLFTTLSSVVRTDSGFMAVGQIKSGSGLTLGVIRFSQSGHLNGTVTLPFPAEVVSSGKSISGEGRKIIALPDGGAALLGQLTVDDNKQIPWAARISADGNILWSRSFPDETGAIAIFSSGYFDPIGGKLIIVGRRTSGADDSQRCTKWSQSLVTALRISDGRQDGSPLVMGSQTSSLTNRQAIWDITAGELPNTYVMVGFASSANKAKRGECQDDILVQTLGLSPPKNNNVGSGWLPGPALKFGMPDAGEVAFAVKRVENGVYLLAGYGKTSDGAPAAQAYRIRFGQTPPVEKLLNTPFPDGSDKVGADRFRAILPLADKSRFLLMGSGKSGRQDRNNSAFWQVVSADLKSNGGVRHFKSQTGSDVFDAALSGDGRVFAVGTWIDGDGQAYGLAGFISIEDQSEKIVLRRRLPDSQLSLLTDLMKSNNVYQIPAAKLFSVPGYFGRDMPAEGINLGFSLTNSRTLRITALSDGGNLDIVLLDGSKRPIAFSNYNGPTTQLLVATLPAGSYTASIFPNSPGRSYEIGLTPSAEFSVDALTQLQSIPEERRPVLAAALREAGYGTSPEPDICFGSETLRSLSAAQSSAPPAFSPFISASFDPIVTQALKPKP
jgi:hypothetical protein